jgi:hypothetical protein
MDIDAEITKWVATRMDEAVLNPKDCYFPFDVVADAYTTGVKSGKDSFGEELRDKYYTKAKLSSEALGELISKLDQQGYEIHKFFLNHNFNNTIMMVSIDKNIHENDEFIDFAYGEAINIKNTYSKKELNLDILFLDDSEHLNYNLIKSDGFNFIYDFKNKVKI